MPLEERRCLRILPGTVSGQFVSDLPGVLIRIRPTARASSVAFVNFSGQLLTQSDGGTGGGYDWPHGGGGMVSPPFLARMSPLLGTSCSRPWQVAVCRYRCHSASGPETQRGSRPLLPWGLRRGAPAPSSVMPWKVCMPASPREDVWTPFRPHFPRGLAGCAFSVFRRHR